MPSRRGRGRSPVLVRGEREGLGGSSPDIPEQKGERDTGKGDSEETENKLEGQGWPRKSHIATAAAVANAVVATTGTDATKETAKSPSEEKTLLLMDQRRVAVAIAEEMRAGCEDPRQVVAMRGVLEAEWRTGTITG